VARTLSESALGILQPGVVSSDAVRARLTAEAVVEAAGCAGAILLDRRLYMASPADILSLVRNWGRGPRS
jgi:phosphohistidine phosphatase SixA